MAEGSIVPGFRTVDFDTSCPATGLPCPVQEKLVNSYVGHVDDETDKGESFYDRSLLVAKLTEYHVAGRLIDYANAPDDFCVTRAAMDNSLVRAKTLSTARGLKRLFSRADA